MPKKSFASRFKRKMKAAVILHGCGDQDGTDIMEVTSLIIALSEVEANVKFFAPDQEQTSVVNHKNGKVMKGETRNILEESARLVGKDVQPLNKLKAKNFDALFMTGGMGVNNDLTNFQQKNKDMEVIEELEQIILDFHTSQKFLGFCSNAPIILAKVLGKKRYERPGLLLTFGQREQQGLAKIADKFGNEIKGSLFNEVTYDSYNRVVTVPGNSTGNRRPADVFASMQYLVQQVNANIKGGKPASKTVSILSIYEVNEGQKEAFEEAMFDYSYLTRQEEGCVRFDVLEGFENNHYFQVLRVFRDIESMIAHKDTPHYMDWNDWKASSEAVSNDSVKVLKGSHFDLKVQSNISPLA